MRRLKRLQATTLAIAALVVAALAFAPGASAATSYGSECEGNAAHPGENTVLESFGATKGVPVSGVITAWKMKSVSAFAAYAQRLKIARRAPGSEPVITAESAPVAIAAAGQGVATRLPVQAGDLIGLASPAGGEGTVICYGGVTGEVFLATGKDLAVGETAAVGPSGTSEQALPVRVTIEPDVDGDGFGDETQDLCPTNPLVHTACPLSAPATGTAGASLPAPPTPHPLAVAVAHKGSATVKVTCDVAATVAVKSRIGLGGGAKVTPSAAGKAIAAGGTSSFTLKFPQALKEKLAALPAKQSLTLHATVLATSAAGPVGTASVTLKLHGRG